jgi:rhodanese-related sulfurtransferase
MVPSIGCRDLFSRLGDDQLVVVDCRRESEAADQIPCVPGALHMPLSELLKEAHILPDDELIVLCGIEPDGSDSRQAYRLLRIKGRDAVCLEGGVAEWLTLGYPTEPYRRLSRTPQMVSASLMPT